MAEIKVSGAATTTALNLVLGTSAREACLSYYLTWRDRSRLSIAVTYAFNLHAIPLPRKGESFLLRTTSKGRDCVILVDVGWRATDAELGRALDANLTSNMPKIEISID